MPFEIHPDSELFDERYPPDKTLPRSDEYTDDSQVGMYGRSTYDLAIIAHVDERKVWSVLECDGSMFMSPGFRMVNWIQYFVSENMRPLQEEAKDFNRDYQITIEHDCEEDD